MTSKPRLMSRTPDNDDLNSLIPNAASLLADRSRRRLAVVEYYVGTVEEITDGDDIPKVRVVHWEDVPDSDEDAVAALRNGFYSARTGSKTAPGEPSDTPLEGIGDDVDDSV